MVKLTGENKLLQVDILQDVGKSINEAIDFGQIEGGFIQGTGWLTIEEVNWNSIGKLTTQAQESSGILTTYMLEVFKNHKIIKIFQKENYEF